MTPDALADFYGGYTAAFTRHDSDALVAAWSFPATIAGPRGNAVFDAAAFRRNVEALFGFYDRQGVVKATATVAAMTVLGDDVVLSQTDYAMLDRDGALIAGWQTPYMLRANASGLRAFAAVADSEIAAWAARGTPMGGR
jgi:hypothetical protein